MSTLAWLRSGILTCTLTTVHSRIPCFEKRILGSCTATFYVLQLLFQVLFSACQTLIMYEYFQEYNLNLSVAGSNVTVRSSSNQKELVHKNESSMLMGHQVESAGGSFWSWGRRCRQPARHR